MPALRSHVLALLIAAPVLGSALASAGERFDPEAAAAAWWDAQVAVGAVAFPDAVTADVRVVLPWAGGVRVRLAQSLAGVPVAGEEIVLSFDPDGALRRVSGGPVDDVLLDPVPTVPAVEVRAEARAVAARAIASSFPASSAAPAVAPPRVGTPSLAAFRPTPRAPLRLAWRVPVRVVAPEPRALFVWVDAHTGHVLRIDPASFSAQGSVYLTSPLGGGPTTVELPGIDGDRLDGPLTTVRSCDPSPAGDGSCVGVVAHAEADEDGDFFYPPAPDAGDDPFAEVQLYYHLDLVARWFDERFAFAHDAPLPGVANFPVANAFFGDLDGDDAYEVGTGQTDTVDFAYDAEVVYHEYTHSVHVGVQGWGPRAIFDEYGVDTAPGALAEGWADSFAMFLSGDPGMGEYAGQALGFYGPVRDLEPDQRCPDAITGSSHADGTIWGSLAWNLADDDRIGIDVAADLYYGALTALPADAGWAEAGDALVDSAWDLFEAGVLTAEEVTAVEELATAAGVFGCSRVRPLDDGRQPTFVLIHVEYWEDLTSPLPLQFSLTAPDDATALDFVFEDFLVYLGDLEWNLFVRKDAPIVFEDVAGGGEPPLHQPVEYDEVYTGTLEFQYQLREDTDPAIDPGTTYYFAVTLGTPAGAEYEYGLGVVTVKGQVLDQGLRNLFDESDGGSGCAACGGSVAGSAPAAGRALLGLFVVAAAVRTRRRRGPRASPSP